LASAGLGFVGIDDEVRRPAIGLLRHEGPFHAGRETGAATAAQFRLLDLFDDIVLAELHQGLGIVPDAAALGAGQTPIVLAIEIAEDAILVFQHHLTLLTPASRHLPSAWSPRQRARNSTGRSADHVSASCRP